MAQALLRGARAAERGDSMTTLRDLSTFALPFALLVGAACTQPVATPIPYGDGWGPGGGSSNSGPSNGSSSGSSSGGKSSSGSTSSGGNTSSSGGSGSGSSSGFGQDAGIGGYDSGGVKVDAGGAYDAGNNNNNTGGCQNVQCATDTNQCGCQATDSNGDTVLLGCQAGGDCVCLVNGNPDGQPFPENGACADNQSTQAQFLTSCTCQ
jgi:hypothetical protein